MISRSKPAPLGSVLGSWSWLAVAAEEIFPIERDQQQQQQDQQQQQQQ